MEIERDARGFTERGRIDYGYQNYYALLDCGFRLRPTAGTASGVHPVPLGFGRVYVHLEDRFSYDGWVRGLDAGRSFVTTGPMLFVRVNERDPGHTFDGTRDKSRPFRVTGSAWSGPPLKTIEIVVNGEVARVVKPLNRKTDRGAHESPIDERVPIEGSSWIAVRCYEDRPDGRVRFAHSSSVHIDLEEKPLRPRRAEVAFLIERVEKEIARSADLLPPEAIAEYRDALRIYKEIAETAR
jgi:hypothetical protein